MCLSHELVGGLLKEEKDVCLNLWRAKGGQEAIEKSERKLLCVFFYFNLDNREAESKSHFGGYLGTYMHNT